jgi:hypothetical protein
MRADIYSCSEREIARADKCSGVRRGELTYPRVASTVHGGRYDALDAG